MALALFCLFFYHSPPAQNQPRLFTTSARTPTNGNPLSLWPCTKSINTSRSALHKRLFHLDRLLLILLVNTRRPHQKARGNEISTPLLLWISDSVSSHSSSSPSYRREGSYEFTMDWEGQKLCEQLMQIMLLGFAVVALGAGYFIGSFMMMLQIYTAGVVLTTLITVPNWPFFNRHPLKWLDPIEAERHPLKPNPVPVTSTTKKSSSKSHQK